MYCSFTIRCVKKWRFLKKAIRKSDPPPFRKAHTPNSPPNAEKKEKERGKKIGIDFFATRAAPRHSSPCGRTAYDQRSTNILDQEGTKNEQFLGRVIFSLRQSDARQGPKMWLSIVPPPLLKYLLFHTVLLAAIRYVLAVPFCI